jgi:hypothetical protein
MRVSGVFISLVGQSEQSGAPFEGCPARFRTYSSLL